GGEAGLLQRLLHLQDVVAGVVQRGEVLAVVLGDADEQGVLLALRLLRPRGGEGGTQHGQTAQPEAAEPQRRRHDGASWTRAEGAVTRIRTLGRTLQGGKS